MPSKRTDKGMAIAAAALIADQISKAAALRIERPVDLKIVSLIPPAYNTGAAFSIGAGSGWLLIALMAALMLGIIIYLRRGKNVAAAERIGLWIVIGGGLGNLIDRVFRTGVVDFIECKLFDFPVFNVGDICVCCGIGVAAIAILSGMRKRDE